ncbi:unnamed protein product [Musa banksii]
MIQNQDCASLVGSGLQRQKVQAPERSVRLMVASVLWGVRHGRGKSCQE